MNESRMREISKTRLFAIMKLVPLAIVLSIGLMLLGGALSSSSPITFHDLGDIFEQHCNPILGLSCDKLRSLISVYVWPLVFFLPFTLLFEYYAPAKTSQNMVSLGLRQDQIWFILHGLLQTYLFVYYFLFFYSVANDYLGFIKIDYRDNIPVPLQIILVILCADFLSWFQHYLRHHVPFFWRFHKIHHSQKEINFFTAYRLHPVDTLVSKTIRFLPFFSLQLDVALPTFFIWVFYKGFINKFSHGNVKTNFGPLRYVLVTPQSHRIHHSIDLKHRDKNFGSIFSIWDFVFRTQYLGFHEYPDTGISDKSFPHGESTKNINLILTTIRQLFFPFRGVSGNILNTFNSLTKRI